MQECDVSRRRVIVAYPERIWCFLSHNIKRECKSTSGITTSTKPKNLSFQAWWRKDGIVSLHLQRGMHCQIAKQFHKNKMVNLSMESGSRSWLSGVLDDSFLRVFEVVEFAVEQFCQLIKMCLQCVAGTHVPGFCKAREDKHAVEIINCALIWSSFWSFGFIHKAEDVLVHVLESWHPHPLHCLLHWIVRGR